MELLNTQVRVADEVLDFYFSDEGYDCFVCPTGKDMDSYDRMMETMLFMSMFENLYPGKVIQFYPDTGNYLVKFPEYQAWFNPNNLIYKE